MVTTAIHYFMFNLNEAKMRTDRTNVYKQPQNWRVKENYDKIAQKKKHKIKKKKNVIAEKKTTKHTVRIVCIQMSD